MTGILLLMCLAPLTVAAGLLLFESVPLTFLFFHGGVCALVPLTDMVIYRKHPKVFFQELGLRMDGRKVSFAVLWGLLLFAAVFLFFSLLQGKIWKPDQISEVISKWGVNSINPVAFVIMMVLGNGFLEEFFWRGYVVHRLSTHMGKWGVILLSSAFYASYHSITTGILFSLPYAVFSTVSIFLVGGYWAWIRLRSGSLLLPLVTHLFVDLAIMAVYLRYLT